MSWVCNLQSASTICSEPFFYTGSITVRAQPRHWQNPQAAKAIISPCRSAQGCPAAGTFLSSERETNVCLPSNWPPSGAVLHYTPTPRPLFCHTLQWCNNLTVVTKMLHNHKILHRWKYPATLSITHNGLSVTVTNLDEGLVQTVFQEINIRRLWTSFSSTSNLSPRPKRCFCSFFMSPSLQLTQDLCVRPHLWVPFLVCSTF